MTASAAEFIRRLDLVERRLRAHAEATVTWGALTDPDPLTGERWEAGQVWAHVAEFIPYWVREAKQLVEHGRDEPQSFGRTKADPDRLAAIDRDRRSDRTVLWNRIAREITGLRVMLAGLDSSAWRCQGRHPTLGQMDLGRLVDEFLIGHLEQHADQLDALTPSGN